MCNRNNPQKITGRHIFDLGTFWPDLKKSFWPETKKIKNLGFLGEIYQTQTQTQDGWPNPSQKILTRSWVPITLTNGDVKLHNQIENKVVFYTFCIQANLMFHCRENNVSAGFMTKEIRHSCALGYLDWIKLGSQLWKSVQII